MGPLYTTLKYVHVLLAITAVGTNITYAIWLPKAEREPQHLGFTLRMIKFLDDRVANPAYGFLLITGLAMVLVGGYNLRTTQWIGIGLGLYVLLLVGAGALFSPNLKRLIKALDSEGQDSVSYLSAKTRNTAIGVVLSVLALLIVLDMVFKPRF